MNWFILITCHIPKNSVDWNLNLTASIVDKINPRYISGYPFDHYSNIVVDMDNVNIIVFIRKAPLVGHFFRGTVGGICW